MKVDVRDEFKDLMKEETKQQLSIRYDEKTLRNKEKMEQIQKDMRLANKVQRYDDNDVEEEDEYEDYFNNKMNEDLDKIIKMSLFEIGFLILILNTLFLVF